MAKRRFSGHSKSSIAPYETSPLRKRLKLFYDSDIMMTILTASVVVSVMLVIFETDAEARGSDLSVWLRVLNVFLLLFYMAELVGRIYVERWLFPKQVLNLVDVSVVFIDFVRLCAGSSIGSFFLTLRAMRLVRLGTSMCIMVHVPELAHMIRGVLGALKALFWGAVLIFFILIIWGILATQLIHPLNIELTQQGVWADAGCARCPRAFESVFQSMLTFTQQILAGDSWGQITVPIVEAYPQTIVFFILVLLSVQLAIINLILAVVLDKAAESQQQTNTDLLNQKEADFDKARLRFIELCKEMDSDKSGQLSFQEILTGFQHHEDFAVALKAMDIEQGDLELVFKMMDSDNSGSVDYAEFADNLFKMRNTDIHTMVVFIRYYVSDVWRRVRAQSSSKASCMSERAHTPQRSGSGQEVPEAAVSIAVPSVSSQGLQAEPERKSMSAAAEANVGTSAWSEKVEKVLPFAEPKLPQPPAHSEELFRLRTDLEVSLRGLSEKLEVHTRMLQSLPLIIDRSSPDAWAGPGPPLLLPGPDGLPCEGAAPAIPAEEAPLGLKPERRPKKEAPTTMICCRPTHEEVRRLR